MSRMLKKPLRWLSLALVFSAWNCGDGPAGPLSRGGGSDTETLTGLVATATGAPAARVAVKLLPSGYDPSRPDSAALRVVMTNDSGVFKFEKLDSAGRYNLIAGEAGARAWAFAESLRTGADRKQLALKPAKTFLISLPASGGAPYTGGTAYFPGTDILAHCTAAQVAVVDSVPPGVGHIVVESDAGWKKDSTFAVFADPATLADTAEVKAAQDSMICTYY